jgi:hypothetical protein
MNTTATRYAACVRDAKTGTVLLSLSETTVDTSSRPEGAIAAAQNMMLGKFHARGITNWKNYTFEVWQSPNSEVTEWHRVAA